MKKRILSLVLAIALVFTLAPLASFADDSLVLKKIFDDKEINGTLSSWGVASPSIIDTSFKKEGEASIKVMYQPNSGQSTTAIFTKFAITPEMRENGMLQFWYYSETDMPNVTIAFSNPAVDGKSVENRVSLKNKYLYAGDAGKWTLVQIPLTEFQDNGVEWNGTGFDSKPFDFSSIECMYFYGVTKGLEKVEPVYFDSIAIVDKSLFVERKLEGTKYYVSPNGSDSNNGLSPEKPFKTPQFAADKTKAGDTVYFMEGVYDNRGVGRIMTIKNNGSPEGYITYTNYENHKPKFTAGGNTWDCVFIMASYIIIDGLTLEGYNDQLTVEEGAENYEEFIKHQDTDCGYDNAKHARTNTNGITLNGRIATGNDELQPHHIVIRNCDISKFPAAGIGGLEVDYVTVENNVIYDNQWYSYYGGSGVSLLNSPDTDDNETEYKNIIRNNIIYNNKCLVMCQNGRKWSDGNGIIIDYNKNTDHKKLAPYKGRTLIKNNLVYNNGGSGILAFNSSNIDIVNNTVYDNGVTPELVHWGNIAVNWCTNVRVVNNIVLATREGTTTLNYGTKNKDIFFVNNLHFNYVVPEKDYTKLGKEMLKDENDYGNLWADPKFVDFIGLDFNLTEASPAVDSGTKTLAPDDDFNGAPRPKGANIDMGAIESEFTSANPVTNNDIDFEAFKKENVVAVEAAQCAKGKPVIDGVMDEIWQNTETFKTAKYSTGDSGATATVKTMWHDDFLYAWVEVKDPELDASNEKVYTKDSVEFFIDENNENTIDYKDDDCQYRVNYLGEYSNINKDGQDKFVAKVTVVDGGYNVEVAIPFRIHKPTSNKIIGFDVQINDADPGQNNVKSQAKWSDKENTTWQDTSRFGDLLLVDSFTRLESSDATVIKISIDANTLTGLDVDPFIFEGRTLVPLRAIFEALGATVEWDDATQTVTGTKDGNVVTLQIDNNIASKNGTMIKLDVPAMLKNDRTMVPVRFIAESLGCKVEWFAARNLVLITTK